MSNVTGRIIKCSNGSEANLVLPIGKYEVVILLDDSCGVGKGKIIRSQLGVYKLVNNEGINITGEVFNKAIVDANEDTILKAINTCKRLNECE